MARSNAYIAQTIYDEYSDKTLRAPSCIMSERLLSPIYTSPIPPFGLRLNVPSPCERYGSSAALDGSPFHVTEYTSELNVSAEYPNAAENGAEAFTNAPRASDPKDAFALIPNSIL